MKTLDLNNIELQKDQLANRISDILNDNCTNNAESCPFARCGFQGCAKDHFMSEDAPDKRRPLKNLLSSLNGSLRKKKGKRSPFNDGNTLDERIQYVLGQNILEHELIKGCEWAIMAVKRCTTLNQVVQILDRRHIHLHGKSRTWSYDPKNIHK